MQTAQRTASRGMTARLPDALSGLIRIAILGSRERSDGAAAAPLVPQRLVIEALLFDAHALECAHDRALERLPDAIGQHVVFMAGAHAQALLERVPVLAEKIPPRDASTLFEFLCDTGTAQTQTAPWLLDAARAILICPEGRSIALTASEQAILAMAAADRGTAVTTRARLIDALGHQAWSYDERRLETLISRLKRKVAQHTSRLLIVRSVRGKGYMFSRISGLNTS